MGETISYRSPTYYELAAPPELDWRPYRKPEWSVYRTEWDRRAREREAGDFPLHLDIDPTNRCNLRCAMCPRTYYLNEGRQEWAPGGRLGNMNLDLYQNLLDEGRSEGLQSVKLNFLGEPLMHPDLVEMVTRAAEAGLWVMINTNATLLTPEKAEALLNAGLSDIFFSFDSPYPEAYEAIRVGADYGQTLANIAGFMDLRQRLGRLEVQTRASMVLPGGLNAAEEQTLKRDYIKLFRDMGVAEIGFGLPTVMGLDYQKTYGLIPGFVCPDIFRRLFVFWDGPVGPCCGDWERRLIMGDARRESLKSIWGGPAYRELRRRHREGRYQVMPACRACSVPYLSTASGE